MKVGLCREDALCRSRWSVGANLIAPRLRESGHPHLLGILSDFNHFFILRFSIGLFLALVVVYLNCRDYVIVIRYYYVIAIHCICFITAILVAILFQGLMQELT